MNILSQMLSPSPKKVTLQSYSDASFKSRVKVKVGSSYHDEITLPINPENLSMVYQRGVTRIDTVSTSGSAKTKIITPARHNTNSQERSLNTSFILDDTLPESRTRLSVQDSIDVIKGLCTAQDTKSEAPVWLKLRWGTTEYTGLVSHLTIDLQMFDRGGAPIRARLNLSLSDATADPVSSKGSGFDIASLPILESTTLTALLALVVGVAGLTGAAALTQTGTPYGNENDYLDIASDNDLDSLNDLPVGGTLATGG